MWKFFTSSGAQKLTPATVVRPMVRLTKSADQSITNGTTTAVEWDQETYKTQTSLHDNATNNSRITISTPGRYRFNAHVQFSAATGSTADIVLRKNGVNVAHSETDASGWFNFHINSVIDCVSGDYIEVAVENNTGGARSVDAEVLSGVKSTWFEAEYVGDPVISYVGVPGSLIGQELAWIERTADISTNTAITTLTAPSFSANGSTKVRLELTHGPISRTAGSNTSNAYLALKRDGVEIKKWFMARTSGAATIEWGDVSGTLTYYDTPPAGNPVYTVELSSSHSGDTYQMRCGADATYPGQHHLRITRAA